MNVLLVCAEDIRQDLEKILFKDNFNTLHYYWVEAATHRLNGPDNQEQLPVSGGCVHGVWRDIAELVLSCVAHKTPCIAWCSYDPNGIKDKDGYPVLLSDLVPHDISDSEFVTVLSASAAEGHLTALHELPHHLHQLRI